MEYIWDPEFDVIAAAIAKDARAAAVEEVVVVVAAAAAAADEPAKLPQEKNNNRNGALNWGIPENQSMMEIISEGGQYTYFKSNPNWVTSLSFKELTFVTNSLKSQICLGG